MFCGHLLSNFVVCPMCLGSYNYVCGVFLGNWSAVLVAEKLPNVLGVDLVDY